MGWILILVLGFMIIFLFFPRNNAIMITYDQFRDSLVQEKVQYVLIAKSLITGSFKRQKTLKDSASGETETTIRDFFRVTVQQKKSSLERSRQVHPMIWKL
jgi:hypothetical protein